MDVMDRPKAVAWNFARDASNIIISTLTLSPNPDPNPNLTLTLTLEHKIISILPVNTNNRGNREGENGSEGRWWHC